MGLPMRKRHKPLSEIDARKRLLGTWRSDRKRTLAQWHFYTANPKHLKMLRAMFGKLVLRYTPTRCYIEFEGNKTVGKYEVVWSDQSSVFLKNKNDQVDERPYQIVFDSEDCYYLLAGRANIEFFRRVKNTAAPKKRTSAIKPKR